MERETGIEPATNSLEGCDSAIELLPRTCRTHPAGSVPRRPGPWSRREDSNPRPSDYKSDALPTELRRPRQASVHHNIEVWTDSHLCSPDQRLPAGRSEAEGASRRTAGWEAGIRTPINRSRVCRVTVTPPPSSERYDAFSHYNARSRSGSRNCKEPGSP